jgi:tRNA/rRNA methyltransferase
LGSPDAETALRGEPSSRSVPRFRVVLVSPLYEGNIGHVARAIMNFDAEELAIVDCPPLTDEGRDRAVHAQKILNDAILVDSVDAAIAGCDLSVGFTGRVAGRQTDYHRNPLDLRDWAPEGAARPGKIALVFGPEDRGLSNEESKPLDLLVTIPTSEKYRSLNLSHAVTVALYALYTAQDPERRKTYTPAEREQLDRLVSRFAEMLENSDYPVHRRVRVATMLRRILGRAEVTTYEVHTLLGVMRDVLFHLRGRREARPDAERPYHERGEDPGMDLEVLAATADREED